MRFRCEIRCDTAAFDPRRVELVRLLMLIAVQVIEQDGGEVVDRDGNTVGLWALLDDQAMPSLDDTLREAERRSGSG